jgi:hypothetical protein
MVGEKSELLYEKIAKVCGIAIPLLYLFGGLLCIFCFVMAGVILISSGDISLNDADIDLASISMTSRIVMALACVFVSASLMRLFWLVIQVAKHFKVGDIFSKETADFALSAAFTLLILYCAGFFIGMYGAVLTGDLQLSFPTGIASIAFAYLFAWVLNIGAQLKVENDLTV